MATGDQNRWIAQVLRVELPGAGTAAREADPAATPSGRLAAAASALAALKAEGVPELPQLLAAAKAAQSGLAGPDAPALLDALEAMIATTQSAARGRVAASSNKRGLAYPKLLLVWRTAQTQAEAAVTALGKTILARPDVQADPRLDRAKQAVALLPGLIPKLGDELADLLDKGINAGSDAAVATDALATVRAYRNSLAAAAPLARLEAFAAAHAGGLGVLKTLDGALAGIADSLAASS